MTDSLRAFPDFQFPMEPDDLNAESAGGHDASNLDQVSDEEIAELKLDILNHLQSLKLPSWANGEHPSTLSKEGIRLMHAHQRAETLARERAALGRKWPMLLDQFADGSEVTPSGITPMLVPVLAGDWTSDLFRLAALLWSVPVSKGYGRRMRYLVRDQSNGKLIGIFALGDPVFNLRARDEWIGWDVEQRRTGLVHMMDAHVVGAVPPYSSILGGKLVASLIGSREVSEGFAKRYSEAEGIISKRQKAARLVLVSVTSALGRSSLYNRLRLTEQGAERRTRRTLVELVRIGATEGYGHFQLSDRLFHRLRDIVLRRGHAYANAHQFGQGPNWRIRVSRVGLAMLGLDPELLRHGISREIFVMPMAPDCREFLRGEVDEIRIDRPTVRHIADAAKTRWTIPRSERDQSYKLFTRAALCDRFEGFLEGQTLRLPSIIP